ncbi:MAG: phytanoyl-CoA dioxygenase family protein [Gammaproteobacteria bacterium]|nr:phytanoyl-CoA dioxygenase family protein [Gammaproteobacteria bacterium]
MSLSAEQIGFFRSNGYLLVPGAMEVDLCARVREMMWQALPPGASLARNDVTSHVGPFPDADRSADSLHFREGYWTLPYGNTTREPDACHTDGHPFQLGVVGLIDDIPKDSGAFKVWPGSHKRLYPTFQLRYDQPRIPYYDHLPSFKGIVHTPEYLAEIEKLNSDTEAVECWGSTGDIVFWHHREAHMAGHNYSDVIRQAVLADFWKTDFDHRRMEPAQGEMWRDWSAAMQASDGRYSTTFAEAQRLG